MYVGCFVDYGVPSLFSPLPPCLCVPIGIVTILLPLGHVNSILTRLLVASIEIYYFQLYINYSLIHSIEAPRLKLRHRHYN